MNQTRVCVLGGSALPTPLLFDALGRLNASGEYDFTLHGRDAQKLDLVRRISEAIIQTHPELRIRISTTSDAASALSGADYVINQLRAGEPRDRMFYESFPRKFNIPGEESVGPGGFANALQIIPLVLDFCKLIEQHAPEATLLNLTNPGGLMQHAVSKATAVNCIGTCYFPYKTIRAAAALLQTDESEVQAGWFGTHHFGWLLSIHADGRDRMADIIRQADKIFGLGIDPEIISSFGAVPAPHLAYLFHPDRILAATEGRALQSAAAFDQNRAMQARMEAWRPGENLDFMHRFDGKRYRDAIAPALIALAEKKPTELVLSTVNQGVVPFLPEDAIVETRVPINNGQLGQAVCPDSIPAEIVNLTQINATYEQLAAEAILEKDIEKAKRALLINPMVQNFNQVKGILAEVWPEKETATFQSISLEKENEAELVIPTLYFSEQAIEMVDPPEERFAVITMEVPWKMAEARFTRPPVHVMYIEELDWYSLEAMERGLPEIDAVIGLGGGMATDAAKYVAWKRRIPMDAVPTITSVDASVTKSIAARAGGHVTYIGYIVPRNVYIDYPTVMNAPKRLNRSGAGDILCAHTALYDWKLGHDHQDERYDPEAAAAMQIWLEKIASHAADIREVNQAGVKIIMQAFEDISIICRRFGSSRPQEGADHTFAYNAEYQTGKHFLHGELVALGTYVIANLQRNEPELIRSVFEQTGLLWQPKDLEMTRDDFRLVMKTLNWYQQNFGRRYSVLDEVQIDEQFTESLMEKLLF